MALTDTKLDSWKMGSLTIFYPFKLLVCTILATLLFATWLVTIAVWLPPRLLVQLLAKAVRKDLDGMLRPSRVFVSQEDLYSKPEFNLIGFNVFDGIIPIDLVRSKFRERVLNPKVSGSREAGFEFNRLKTSVTTFCGYYFWKRQKQFKLENYIRTYEDLLLDGDVACAKETLPLKPVYSEEDLKTIVSYLTTKRWKRNQSPWEIIVLQNLQSEYCIDDENLHDMDSSKGNGKGLQTVFMYRLHHCLADGYSMQNLVAKFNGYKDDVTAVPVFKERKLCLEVLRSFMLPFKAFGDMVLYLASAQWDRNDWSRAPKGPGYSSFMTTWGPDVRLDRIKNLKNRFNVSFFAVLQSISAGVFAKMMRSTGARVPEKISCFLPLPLPNHPLGMHIHCATTIVTVHTGESDPVKRLMMAQKSMDVEKHSTASLMMTLLYKTFCLAPNFFISRFVSMPSITGGFSPFPGYAGVVKFTPEHVCRRCYFTVGLPRSGNPTCNMTSLSSFGNIVFTFTSRRHVMDSRKQIEQFAQFLEEEICALEKAARFVHEEEA